MALDLTRLALLALVLILTTGSAASALAQTPASGLAISGAVWQDDNADGRRQEGEPGIANVFMRLATPAGAGVAETYTDASGRYGFDSLAAARYVVEASLFPGPWLATAPARILQGKATASVTLQVSPATVDFGFYPSGSLPRFAGSAWIDAAEAPSARVRAVIDGVDCTLPGALGGLIPPDSGITYTLSVAAAELLPGCGEEGDTISFTLNGRTANETAVWHRESSPSPTPGTPPRGPGLPGRFDLTVGPPFARYFGTVLRPRAGPDAGPNYPRVQAFVAETECGAVEHYGAPGEPLVVPSELLRSGCGRDGAMVRFVIEGEAAPEQVPWRPGLQQVTLTARVVAVPPNVFRVIVPRSSLATPVFVRGVANLGQALRSLTAYADGVVCTTAELAGTSGDVVIDIGLPGQPPACSREGARLTFVDGNGLTLFTKLTLRRGEQQALVNLGPEPPSSGGAIRPPGTGDAGLRAAWLR